MKFYLLINVNPFKLFQFNFVSYYLFIYYYYFEPVRFEKKSIKNEVRSICIYQRMSCFTDKKKKKSNGSNETRKSGEKKIEFILKL